jgi:hypothetical protein
MQGKLSDLSNSFKRTIDRLVADMFAAKAATALFGKDFGKSEGGEIGGLVGAGIKALSGAFGSGGPELLNSFAVGTSYVPQDMIAMVHKGEAIIPANQNNSSAGAMVLNFNFAPGTDVAGFRASRNQIVGELQAALSASRRNR